MCFSQHIFNVFSWLCREVIVFSVGSSDWFESVYMNSVKKFVNSLVLGKGIKSLIVILWLRRCEIFFRRAGKYITWHWYTVHEFNFDILVIAVVTAVYHGLCIRDIFIKMLLAWLIIGQVKITDFVSCSQSIYCPIFCLTYGRAINLNFSCKLKLLTDVAHCGCCRPNPRLFLKVKEFL